MNRIKRYSWFFIPLLIFLSVILLFRFVFLIGYVPSGSMEPTLKENSYILGIRVFYELRMGDIIVFEHDNQVMVKRIAGQGGDVVQTINGKMVVPNECYYVLGDNAENSYDSRFWEDPFVKKEEVMAKLLC